MIILSRTLPAADEVNPPWIISVVKADRAKVGGAGSADSARHVDVYEARHIWNKNTIVMATCVASSASPIEHEKVLILQPQILRPTNRNSLD